jgi:hypothetical protein
MILHRRSRRILALIKFVLLRIGLRGRLRQLNGPVLRFLPCVNLKKPGPIEAAHKAILSPNDTEFTIPGTHKGLALPFPSVFVHGIDVVVFRCQGPAYQSLAPARLQIPPPLADPCLAIRIGE